MNDHLASFSLSLKMFQTWFSLSREKLVIASSKSTSRSVPQVELQAWPSPPAKRSFAMDHEKMVQNVALLDFRNATQGRCE